MKDLAPDRFSAISSAAQFRLNYLYQDGAKICLMSEHAPAFFAAQMSDAMLNLPLIVMDGAAIYDVEENRYLSGGDHRAGGRPRRCARGSKRWGSAISSIRSAATRPASSTRARSREEENIVYDRMRRSPYRSYLDGENYEMEEIVYLKVIAGRRASARSNAARRRACCPRGGCAA